MSGSPAVLAALAALGAAIAWVVVRFELFCLADLARAEDGELRVLSRQAWQLLIMLWIPFGGLFYLRFGRGR